MAPRPALARKHDRRKGREVGVHRGGDVVGHPEAQAKRAAPSWSSLLGARLEGSSVSSLGMIDLWGSSVPHSVPPQDREGHHPLSTSCPPHPSPNSLSSCGGTRLWSAPSCLHFLWWEERDVPPACHCPQVPGQRDLPYPGAAPWQDQAALSETHSLQTP